MKIKVLVFLAGSMLLLSSLSLAGYSGKSTQRFIGAVQLAPHRTSMRLGAVAVLKSFSMRFAVLLRFR